MIKITTINTTPVEPFLKSVKHEFVFDVSYFEGCKTKEQMIERFEEDCNPDLRYDKIEISNKV